MKEKLGKWKKEIDEISNCVWKVSLTHELGPKVEKIGDNLEQIEKEVELSALEMNEQIEIKIKNYPQQLSIRRADRLTLNDMLTNRDTRY